MEVQPGADAATAITPRGSPHAIPGKTYGWLSRLRSYFILDPLIWFYTLILGLLALPGGLFDRSGRRLALVFTNLVVADHENDLVAGKGYRPG